MALFYFLGKKKRQPDETVEDKEPLVEELVPSSTEDEELAAWREAEQIRMQRDIARMTAEKIDAIESEIARDILKAAPLVANTIPTEETTKQAASKPATDAFQATIIRQDISVETLLLDEQPDD